MPISFTKLLTFFARFEVDMERQAGSSVWYRDIRDVNDLMGLLQGHTTLALSWKQADLSADLEEPYRTRARDFWSCVLIFSQKAEILVNSMSDGNGRPVLNHCYRRYLVLKEGLHIVLRLYLTNESLEYPDLNSADEIIQHTEQLVYLLFSIRDFDSPRYSEALKIEAAAELFAFFLLYPFDALAQDRLKFFGADNDGRADVANPRASLRSTFEFANARKAPQRYVDLLFRDGDFDVTYDRYCQIRESYRSGLDHDQS